VYKQINSINDAKSGLKWFEGYALELLLKERSVNDQLAVDSQESTQLREDLASRELDLEEKLRQEQEENTKLRKEFEDSNKLWTLKFDRVKSLRSNLPAQTKAQDFARRRMARSDSFTSTDTELEFKDVDDEWMGENKDLVKNMENVGLKTPKSIKKRLQHKRSTMRGKGGCACKGNCKTKICGCRKEKKQCGVECKCVKESCANKPDEEDPELSLNVQDLSRELLFNQSTDDKENTRESSGSDFTPLSIKTLKRADPFASNSKRDSKTSRQS